MQKNKILSIQSKLIYGYVGSNIAELAIQLHGFDVISFPTVYLAAHTGHQPIYGTVIDNKLFSDFITGINNLDILKDVLCMLSGYVGSMDILELTTNYVKYLKDKYPDLIYICDPVMGDVDTGLYVSEEVSNHIEHTLLPLCEIMTPNLFEFQHLAKHKIVTIDDVKKAVSKSSLLSSKTVVITSCILADTLPDILETLIVDKGKIIRIQSPKIAIETTGTGDLFTSLLATQISKGKSVEQATEYATQTVGRALSLTIETGNHEMNAFSVLQSINVL